MEEGEDYDGGELQMDEEELGPPDLSDDGTSSPLVPFTPPPQPSARRRLDVDQAEPQAQAQPQPQPQPQPQAQAQAQPQPQIVVESTGCDSPKVVSPSGDCPQDGCDNMQRIESEVVRIIPEDQPQDLSVVGTQSPPQRGAGAGAGAGARIEAGAVDGAHDDHMDDMDDDEEGDDEDEDEGHSLHSEDGEICTADDLLNGSDSDLPLDHDNPRKCPSCSKVFQNHFGVKTHYQNVHLKLMHTCTVDGCNAAFPSKRSRDRHSSNLNLHRKLLSTSSSPDSPENKMADGSALSSVVNQSLRDEFLPRIYDVQKFPGILGLREVSETNNNNSNGGSHQSGSRSVAPSSASSGSEGSDNDECMVTAGQNGGSIKCNGDSIHCGPTSLGGGDHDVTSGDTDGELKPTSLVLNGDIGDPNGVVVAEDAPFPDPDGSATCHVCQQSFRDNLVLKEHFEKVHPKEMYRCTVRGCDKIFSTRKSRNRHSQNDNLHRHLSPTKANGTA